MLNSKIQGDFRMKMLGSLLDRNLKVWMVLPIMPGNIDSKGWMTGLRLSTNSKLIEPEEVVSERDMVCVDCPCLLQLPPCKKKKSLLRRVIEYTEYTVIAIAITIIINSLGGDMGWVLQEKGRICKNHSPPLFFTWKLPKSLLSAEGHSGKQPIDLFCINPLIQTVCKSGRCMSSSHSLDWFSPPPPLVQWGKMDSSFVCFARSPNTCKAKLNSGYCVREGVVVECRSVRNRFTALLSLPCLRVNNSFYMLTEVLL